MESAPFRYFKNQFQYGKYHLNLEISNVSAILPPIKESAAFRYFKISFNNMQNIL
jgi:hypothetical protein